MKSPCYVHRTSCCMFHSFTRSCISAYGLFQKTTELCWGRPDKLTKLSSLLKLWPLVLSLPSAVKHKHVHFHDLTASPCAGGTLNTPLLLCLSQDACRVQAAEALTVNGINSLGHERMAVDAKAGLLAVHPKQDSKGLLAGKPHGELHEKQHQDFLMKITQAQPIPPARDGFGSRKR